MTSVGQFFLLLGTVLAILCSSGLVLAQDIPLAAINSESIADSTSLATALTDTLADDLAEIVERMEIDLWDSGVNPTGAILMTPLFPGWGQLYSDNSWRGALSFGVEMYYWTNMLARDLRATRYRGFAATFPSDNYNHTYYNVIAEENWEQMRDFAWWSGGVLFIIALDAYVGAHLFHFDDDPLPVPNQWDEHFEPLGNDLPGGALSPSITVFQWRKTF